MTDGRGRSAGARRRGGRAGWILLALAILGCIAAGVWWAMAHRWVEITGKDGAPMMLIPAGEFLMGGATNWDAQPVRSVYLDPFYLDKYAVTNRRFRVFLKKTGGKDLSIWSNPKLSGDDQPVVGVSWNDACAYATWAGKRLPTEAEFEKAARGGLAGKKYPWGDEAPARQACLAMFDSPSPQAPAPVGSYFANGYGLYDMAGNVGEWCADWYQEEYYRHAPSRNPPGPPTGDSRVIRGGTFRYFAIRIQCEARTSADPATRRDDVGFRCARSFP